MGDPSGCFILAKRKQYFKWSPCNSPSCSWGQNQCESKVFGNQCCKVKKARQIGTLETLSPVNIGFYLFPYELENFNFFFALSISSKKGSRGCPQGWFTQRNRSPRWTSELVKCVLCDITIYPSPFFSRLSFWFLRMFDLNHQAVQTLSILTVMFWYQFIMGIATAYQCRKQNAQLCLYLKWVW